VALTYFRERLRDGAPRTYDALAKLRFWSPIRPGEAPIEMQVYDRQPPEPVVQAWLQTEHLLALLQSEVAAHGARLLVAYVPSKMEVSRADWELTRRRYRLDESLWDRRLVVRRLETAGQRLGVPVLDLTDALWAEQGRALLRPGRPLERARPCRGGAGDRTASAGGDSVSRFSNRRARGWRIIRLIEEVAMKRSLDPGPARGRLRRAGGGGTGRSTVCLHGGCWAGAKGTTTFQEQWTAASPDLMLGMSYTNKPSKPTEFEFLRIETKAGRADVHGPAPGLASDAVRAERGGLDGGHGDVREHGARFPQARRLQEGGRGNAAGLDRRPAPRARSASSSR
jgi:hypothetical protein